MIFAAVMAGVSMLINGAVSAGTTAAANKIKTNAYQKAATSMKDAANKYSGEGLNKKMFEEGMAEQAKNANLYYDPSWQPGSTSAMGAFNKASQNIQGSTPDLYSQGANRAKTMADANYNAEKTQQDLNMQQADIDSNVTRQAGKAMANAVGGLANLGGQIGGWGSKNGTK